MDLSVCVPVCLCGTFVSLFRWLHLTSIYLLPTSKCRVIPPSMHKHNLWCTDAHSHFFSLCVVLKVVCDVRCSLRCLSLTFFTKSELHFLPPRCMDSLSYLVTKSCQVPYANWSHFTFVCVCVSVSTSMLDINNQNNTFNQHICEVLCDFYLWNEIKLMKWCQTWSAFMDTRMLYNEIRII